MSGGGQWFLSKKIAVSFHTVVGLPPAYGRRTGVEKDSLFSKKLLLILNEGFY